MEARTYFAHSGKKDDRSDWQLLPEHLTATAALAAQRGARIGLGATADLAGAFHDLGKYDPDFDGVLCGHSLRVDHSTAGAKLLIDRAGTKFGPVAEVLAYAILGHHAGLPDRRRSGAAMAERLEGHDLKIPHSVQDSCHPVFAAAGAELVALTRSAHSGFDLSVATRMAFSCLVDADFRDTEAFYAQIDGTRHDRDWPALADILPTLRRAFDTRMASFAADTDLNQLRSGVLSYVRARAPMPPGLFTLTVPTGGGKTLASMGFALDHAALHGHRRIIYAIPYTSIIDQTAAIFRDLFGEEAVLEHHSAIDSDRPGAQGRDKLRLAMEDWAAPIVVTTNVQLFESLFAARPSRCRKLHNVAGSVIVLDEAQALPRRLLLPTLRMIDTLAHHYGCSIVLCTATQPAFDSRHLGSGLMLEDRELAPNPDDLAVKLRRARVVQAGPMDDTELIAVLRTHQQAMVIVNSRAHALSLFLAARADGLAGLVHLTTRQYPAHRRGILTEIRRRLTAGVPCRLIATSLIEAGVDFDFPVGWRAAAGLDSVVQAAGRVNREGRRPLKDSTLTVFEATENPAPTEVAQLALAMRRTAGRFPDLLAPAAIRDWFTEVYWTTGAKQLGGPMADRFVFSGRATDFPFRSVAEEYRMIDSVMVPVIIARDSDAATAVAKLGLPHFASGPLARDLQVFTVQIPQTAREILRRTGKGSFKCTDLRGDQFFVLDDNSLYEEDVGLRWEDAEYLASNNIT